MKRRMFMRFPGGLVKALTFSYDDGVEQDIRLVEILNKYGIIISEKKIPNVFGLKIVQTRPAIKKATKIPTPRINQYFQGAKSVFLVTYNGNLNPLLSFLAVFSIFYPLVINKPTSSLLTFVGSTIPVI